MATTSTNVTTGKPKTGGAVYVGSSSATLPSGTAGELTGFTSLGYISDSGLTNDGSISTSTIKAWGGDIVAVTETEKADSFKFTLIEALSEDVLKVVYGDDNVSKNDSTGIKIEVNATPHEAQKWVIDMVLRGDKAKRITIPEGVVTNVSEITYSDSDAVGYEITVTALPDTDGNTHYEYIL